MAKVQSFQRFNTRSGSMLVYTMLGNELGGTGRFDLAVFSDNPHAEPRYPIGADVTVTPELWELSNNQHNPDVPRYVMRRRQREAAPTATPAAAHAVAIVALEGKIAALSERVSLLSSMLRAIVDQLDPEAWNIPQDVYNLLYGKGGNGDIPF